MNEKTVNKLSNFHLRKRKYIYSKKGACSNLIKPRYKAHGFLLKFITLDRLFDKRKLIVIDDNRINTDKSLIFAITHVGGEDIESAFEGIKSPAHLLLGDPKEVYMNLAGLILFFNGIISIATMDKLDRKIGKERCIETLKNGGNILMFPEGAWNISPNQIVYYMFTGAVEMAIETDSQIVPVAVHKDGNSYTVNIGKNIDYYDKSISDKYLLTSELRDAMASLQYEIMLTKPVLYHDSINSKTYDEFVKDVISNQTATYSIQEVYNSRYKPKWITEHSIVFEHLKNIDVNTKTAFLFNKRLK